MEGMQIERRTRLEGRAGDTGTPRSVQILTPDRVQWGQAAEGDEGAFPGDPRSTQVWNENVHVVVFLREAEL